MRARACWHILSSMPLAKKRAGNRCKRVDAAVGTLEESSACMTLIYGEAGSFRAMEYCSVALECGVILRSGTIPTELKTQ
jgi:hypothetical protein